MDEWERGREEEAENQASGVRGTKDSVALTLPCFVTQALVSISHRLSFNPKFFFFLVIQLHMWNTGFSVRAGVLSGMAATDDCRTSSPLPSSPKEKPNSQIDLRSKAETSPSEVSCYHWCIYHCWCLAISSLVCLILPIARVHEFVSHMQT